mgnify:CR=1 FL=1
MKAGSAQQRSSSPLHRGVLAGGLGLRVAQRERQLLDRQPQPKLSQPHLVALPPLAPRPVQAVPKPSEPEDEMDEALRAALAAEIDRLRVGGIEP